MRFIVKYLGPGLFQVVDTGRICPDTRQAVVMSTWRSVAAAAADARFRNEHPA